MASTAPSQGEARLHADRLADELGRRGLAAPAAIVLDAHRPFLPLLRQGAIFVGPMLAPMIGARRFEALRRLLEEPAAYDRLATRLAGNGASGDEIAAQAGPRTGGRR